MQKRPAAYKFNQCKMKYLVVVNALLLLGLAGANPVGNLTDNTTVTIDSADSVSSGDPVYPYCLNSVTNSPKIPELYIELGIAIDILELACTNTSFKRNVSSK